MNEMQQSHTPWHAQSVTDVLAFFRTSEQGLTDEYAKDQLAHYGLNELESKKSSSAFSFFVRQFANPFITILLSAALLSLFLAEWVDAGVILFAVIINTILGFIEEYKADRSMERLKSLLPQQARIRRAGVERIIFAHQIVPGDIVLVNAGDKITADGRIIFSRSLEVNEAALTGESMPVEKRKEKVDIRASVSDRSNMLFAGTSVHAGHAEMVVTDTGKNTQIGKIIHLVGTVETSATPLQHQMNVLARWLSVTLLFVVFFVFITGIIRGLDSLEMARLSIAVAVSAIPEGMVVALTVVLAIGMQRILKKKALVRRLVAAETLGSVSVICMDKTGTLTTGEMAVVEVRNSSGEKARQLDAFEDIAHILWNTKNVFVDEVHEKRFFGPPTEVAIIKSLWEQKDTYEKKTEEILSEIPFHSRNKYKAQLCRLNEKNRLYVVGAPDILLDRLDVSDHQKHLYQSWLEEMIQSGWRVILIAQREDDSDEAITDKHIHDLSFVGLVGLSDPLRTTARQTIEQARAAGLLPVMITGDHPDTAYRIAHEAGLAVMHDQILTGVELDELNDESFAAEVTNIAVYARVLPRHKLRIVHAWQDAGFAVAMVGDGVNDAPAMKGADIGIALGSGTEVAKETADMVLLNDHFAIIVDAIEQGRAIFDNIRKMVVYLLSDSFSEIILIFGAILFGLPIPILPAQILWINLVTDGFPSIALTFEKAEKGIMQEPPRKKDEPILNKEMKVLIFIIGIITDLMLFGIYFYLLGMELNIDHIRTFVFLALGLDSLFYVFAVRKFRTSIFHTNPFENWWLVGGIAIGFLFLLAPMLVPVLREWFRLTPLSVVEWLVLIALAFMQLLMIELIKWLFNRQRRVVATVLQDS